MQARCCSTWLLQLLVLENGPQFISDEFSTLKKSNGVYKNITCASYHPTSDRAVETLVQTFKKAKIATFLLQFSVALLYNTTHSVAPPMKP